MLTIVTLAEYPQYFDIFFSNIRTEFEELFAKYDRRLLEKFYRNRLENIYIALLKKKFVGCYSITQCLIGDLYVVPAMRGKKIGHLLVQDALRRLNTCAWVKLYADKSKVGFYEKMGFSVVNGKDSKRVYMITINYWIWMAFIVLAVIGIVCIIV
jgi:N-acetylglutamate synthase-like GNAT family acetyltransferase